MKGDGTPLAIGGMVQLVVYQSSQWRLREINNTGGPEGATIAATMNAPMTLVAWVGILILFLGEAAGVGVLRGLGSWVPLGRGSSPKGATAPLQRPSAVKSVLDLCISFRRILRAKGPEKATKHFKSHEKIFDRLSRSCVGQLEAVPENRKEMLNRLEGKAEKTNGWLPNLFKGKKRTEVEVILDRLATGLECEFLIRGMEPFPQSQAEFLWQRLKKRPTSWEQFMAYVDSVLAYQQLADLGRLLMEMPEIVRRPDRSTGLFKPTRTQIGELLGRLLAALAPAELVGRIVEDQGLKADQEVLGMIAREASREPAYFATILAMFTRRGFHLENWLTPDDVNADLIAVATAALQSRWASNRTEQTAFYEKTRRTLEDFKRARGSQGTELSKSELRVLELVVRDAQCVSRSPPQVCRLLQEFAQRYAGSASNPRKYPNLAFLVAELELSAELLDGLIHDPEVLVQTILELQHRGNPISEILKRLKCRGVLQCQAVEIMLSADLLQPHAACGPQGSKVTVINLPEKVFGKYDSLKEAFLQQKLARALVMLLADLRSSQLPAESWHAGGNELWGLGEWLNFFFDLICMDSKHIDSEQIPLYHSVPGASYT